MPTTTVNRYDTNTRLAEWLAFVGVPTLVEFQRANGLVPDGIFGRKSFAALQAAMRSRILAIAEKPKLEFERIEVDMHPDALGTFMLRTDAALFFRGLLNEVRAAGGVVTSAGSLRSLSAPVTSGRVPTSMHYAAIAFDLATNSGMRDPRTDPYVIEKDGDFWRVWVRCNPAKAQPDKLPPVRTIANPITAQHRFIWPHEGGVTDHFLDFTAVAAKFGFARIKPHRAFLQPGGNYMSAEWWHFQNEFVLMPGFSTFADELRTMYSESVLRASPVRGELVGNIFGRDWF